MSGHTQKGRAARMLNARTAALFEGETGKDVMDYVCAWLENGTTMLDLARSMTAEEYPDATIDDTTVIHYSPNIIRRVLLDMYTREVIDRRIADSRTVGAHAQVDKATAIIDDVDAYTKEAVQHAKERANVRLWSAERYAKGELGQVGKGTQVQVQVNVGDAHVNAMMRRRVVARVVEAPEDAQVLALEPATSI